jgi:circadian clock protein KaiB
MFAPPLIASLIARPVRERMRMSLVVLKLFVAGSVEQQAMTNRVTSFCDEHLEDQYDLEVIDVLEDPERAQQERVFATPTLCKLAPSPCQRVIGDFCGRRLLGEFGLDE